MEIDDLSLPGLKLIRLTSYEDDRGVFKECYQRPRYFENGIEYDFVQDNLSYSKQNVLRGMHFQTEPGQAKLVWVPYGEIFDVVVDIRPDSPYFGKWIGVYLTSEKNEQLYIPIGFAHGFCVVSPQGAYVHYKVSSIYNPSTEKSFRFDDPHVGIKWPISNPSLSARDLECPTFKEIFQ